MQTRSSLLALLKTSKPIEKSTSFAEEAIFICNHLFIIVDYHLATLTFLRTTVYSIVVNNPCTTNQQLILSYLTFRLARNATLPTISTSHPVLTASLERPLSNRQVTAIRFDNDQTGKQSLYLTVLMQLSYLRLEMYYLIVPMQLFYLRLELCYLIIVVQLSSLKLYCIFYDLQLGRVQVLQKNKQ